VITYAVTCNHIHLLAMDSSSDVISKSMQLVSGGRHRKIIVKHPGQVRVKNDSDAGGGSDDPQEFVIRESQAVYNSDNTAESCVLSGENTVFWANDS